MRYQDIKSLVLDQISTPPTSGATSVTYISGSPGLGKTSLAFDAVDARGFSAATVGIFRPSLHDPVDLSGCPSVEEGITRWAPPKFLVDINRTAEKYGFALLVWDELPQAVPMMQNAIAGMILDRQIGEFKLHPAVHQIATGNRTKDKAGAGRVVSQLGNRLCHLEMEAHLDDWCEWALDTGLDVTTVSFLRFRSGLLSDFEADRFSNPTPRSWEAVARANTALAPHLYHAKVMGLVGEGAAAEYIGFKRIADQLPRVDEILINPTGTMVPTEPAALYAVSGALAVQSTPDNFDRVMLYVDRMPPEFGLLAVKTALTASPKVVHTKSFSAWAIRNSGLLI